MARVERLQKTLSVQPTVASVGSPIASADDGAAIRAAGGLAKTFVSEQKKSNLEDELRSLGDEVFAISQGRQLEKATERFTRLQQGSDQGVVSDSMKNIEAEKILKESIGSMPAFGQELRQEAARILGFDPTGSEIRNLLQVGQSKRPKTFEETQLERAEFVSNNTGVSVDDVMGIFAKSLLSTEKVKLSENSLKFGSITRSQFLNQNIANSENFIMDAIAETQTRISQGGVANPQEFKALMLTQKTAHWNTYRKGLNSAGVFPTSTEIEADRKAFDSEYAGVIAMAEDGSLQKILESKAAAVGALAKLEGVELFPEIAVMNAVGGVPLTQTYLDSLTGIQNESQLKLLAKLNPTLALALGADKTKAFNAFTAGYKKIMGVPETVEAGKVIEEVPEAVEDVLTSNLVQQNRDPEIRAKVLQRLQARGKSFKSFSFYAQSGARAKSTKEEVQYIKDRWGTELEPLIARVASSLESEGAELIVGEGGKVTVRITQDELKKRRLSPLSSGAHVTGSIIDDVNRLNAMGKLLDSGWSGDIGERFEGFSQRVINKTDTLRSTDTVASNSNELQQALAAFNESPTEDSLNKLRELDPELVAEAERRALQRGVDSGE